MSLLGISNLSCDLNLAPLPMHASRATQRTSLSRSSRRGDRTILTLQKMNLDLVRPRDATHVVELDLAIGCYSPQRILHHDLWPTTVVKCGQSHL